MGGALLNLAVAGWVVCIAAVIAAFAFNITLIMFKTGSMSPTIPAGSLAVVKEIPAADINVGDVVTVDRPGKLPVTHRVTSGWPPMATRAASPCVATPTVLTTRLRTPSARCGSCSSRSRGLAYAVVAVSHPLVMGGVTLAAAVLVTWAFWPRTEKRRRVAEERTA